MASSGNDINSPIAEPAGELARSGPAWRPVGATLNSDVDPAAKLAPNALVRIHYGLSPVMSDDPRELHVPLAVMGGSADAEVWSASAPVQIGSVDGIHYSHDEETLFAWLQLDEAALVSVEPASSHAYARMERLLKRLGFPHWLRAWNYLSGINEGVGDEERYRQFNAGRFHALANTPGFERLLPAATAIGARSGGLTICLLAARRAALQIENPRQVSAYQYPTTYGARSPSFSRATLQHCRERSVLFLSGTASIVGHQTTHVGDAIGQLEATLVNIDTLLDHAGRLHFPESLNGRFEPQAFKAYLRSPDVYALLAERLHESLTVRASTAILEADICRRDLLLEIEGVFVWKEGEPNGAGS
ncbi:MAG: hypothetical protein ABL907_00565 [Hyphomicrobium sp.]